MMRGQNQIIAQNIKIAFLSGICASFERVFWSHMIIWQNQHVFFHSLVITREVFTLTLLMLIALHLGMYFMIHPIGMDL